MKRLTITLLDDQLTPVITALANAAQLHDLHIDNVEEATAARTTTKPPRHKSPHRPGGTPWAIMSHFTPSGRFTNKLAEKWMRQGGYATGSATSALHALTAGPTPHLKREGPRGSYTFTFLRPMDSPIVEAVK